MVEMQGSCSRAAAGFWGRILFFVGLKPFQSSGHCRVVETTGTHTSSQRRLPTSRGWLGVRCPVDDVPRPASHRALRAGASPPEGHQDRVFPPPPLRGLQPLGKRCLALMGLIFPRVRTSSPACPCKTQDLQVMATSPLDELVQTASVVMVFGG